MSFTDIKPSGTNIRPRIAAGTDGEPGRVAYQYVVMRCVPRVERQEHINVGVVLFAHETGELYAAHHLDEARARALDPGIDLDGVRAQLERVEAVCRGERGRGLPTLETPGRRFGWLKAPRSSVVQPGPVHGGVCTDPRVALDELMARLVLPVPPPAPRAESAHA